MRIGRYTRRTYHRIRTEAGTDLTELMFATAAGLVVSGGMLQALSYFQRQLKPRSPATWLLSTLHTNSAVETVTRLLDLGCDSFNFADAMLGVIAQRLCKRICTQCKEAYRPTRQEDDELVQGYGAQDWPTLGIEYRADWSLYRGRGCEACNRTGFKGRVPLDELLLPSEDMKQLIQTRS